jgi:hypothetical protein
LLLVLVVLVLLLVVLLLLHSEDRRRLLLLLQQKQKMLVLLMLLVLLLLVIIELSLEGVIAGGQVFECSRLHLLRRRQRHLLLHLEPTAAGLALHHEHQLAHHLRVRMCSVSHNLRHLVDWHQLLRNL